MKTFEVFEVLKTGKKQKVSEIQASTVEHAANLCLPPDAALLRPGYYTTDDYEVFKIVEKKQ